jgi:hypothetical protein
MEQSHTASTVSLARLAALAATSALSACRADTSRAPKVSEPGSDPSEA